MEVKVSGDNNFNTTLSVKQDSESKTYYTTLAEKTNTGGLTSSLSLTVQSKNSSGESIGAGDVGINIQNSQNGKVYYSIDGTNFNEVADGTTLKASGVLSSADSKKIYLKAEPSDGKQLDTNPQQNIIRYDGIDYDIDTTGLKNGTYSFDYSKDKSYSIKITFEGSSGGTSENDTPLGLKIGNTDIITNGGFVAANTQNGITINNNILKYRGLMVENKGNNNFTISVCISEDECNAKDYAEINNGIAKLKLEAFVFTGNGRVEIKLENRYESSGLGPDSILEIGKTSEGYSIYDTNGVELDIRGNWESELNLLGGIYAVRNVKVSDIKQVYVGQQSGTQQDSSDPLKLQLITKGIEGKDNNSVSVEFATNLTMNTSSVALQNLDYFKAIDGGKVNISSSYEGNIVNSVNHVYVEYGGAINLTATSESGAIGIDTPSESSDKIQSGCYQGDSDKAGIQGVVEVRSDASMTVENCVVTSDNTKSYTLSYDSSSSPKSFNLASTRGKLTSIGWKNVKDGDTLDPNYDAYVKNGTFEVKAAKGIKRIDDKNNYDYLFEAGTEITFKLLPNPGYKYTSGTFKFNGGNGSSGATDNMGEYKYVMGDRPVHVACEFEPTDNKVNVDENASSEIKNIAQKSSVELSNADSSSISGELALKIEDASVAEEDKEKLLNEVNSETSEYEFGDALNLSLNQVVDIIKVEDNTTDGQWTTPITDLKQQYGENENVTITLGLDSELQGKDEYTIIREHKTGSEEGATTEYETITPTVDRTNNTITFKTDKFSTYAIAYKGTYTPPYTPPVSNPAPTPTPEPTPDPAPTPAPTEEAKPSMAPVSEDVTTSVSKEVESVVQEIVKGTDTTVVDEDTASKIKEAAEQGKEINTEVVAETVEKDKVDTKEVNAIEEKVKSLQSVVDNVNNTIKKITSVAQFINVEILIKADGEKLGNLKELKEPIKLKIDIPDNLKKSSRKFFVVRLHDGIVEKLESIMNADGTLTFITDKFSTYALAYEDTVAVEKTVGKTKIGSTTRTSTSVTIPWSKVAGATKYRVYYRLKGAKEFKRVGDTTSLKYTVKGLKSATTYEFAIKAYGYGKWSKIYTTRVTTTAPAKVSTPVVKSNAKGKVVLSYKKVTGATGYQVYIAKGNGSYKRFACGKLTTVTKSKLTRGATYKFKVRAYKKVGDNVYYGAYSSAKVVKVK